jgi:hypothetical protein
MHATSGQAMKSAGICVALLVVLAPCANAAEQTPIESADRLFQMGEFAQANVPGLYDGPFPWKNLFGFHLAGMVGHDFFKPHAVTFDFQNMKVFLQ